MGAEIAYHGRTVVGAGGTATLTYTHDPKGRPSRVGIIATAIDSGTKTGRVRIYYGNDAQGIEIANGTFVANDPSVVVHPHFTIQPGQTIRAVFSSITQGDVVSLFVGGH